MTLRPGERSITLWSAAYGFCLLASYNVVKPFREALGTAVPGLSRLWMGTLIACLIVLPPYWALVGRLPWRRFVPLVHRFFELAFALSFFLLRDEKQPGFARNATCFYAGVSAFNLLVLSQFWGVMVDIFTREQGRRLFGWIAAGGTAGGLLASLATTTLAHNRYGPAALVWLTIALLELASFAAGRLARRVGTRPATATAATAGVAVDSDTLTPDPRPRGLLRHVADIFEGARLFAKSPYLLAIAAYMFATQFTSAFVYDFQRKLIGATIVGRAAQTEYSAWINSWTQLAALAGQLVVTARLIAGAGLGITLALVHATGLLGLAAFALQPTLWVISAVQIAIKSVDYAFARPARETLFTIVSRKEKYQSKSLIDAGLYRAFDALDSGIVDRLRESLVTAPGMAWIAIPVTALGLLLSGHLARAHLRAHERQRAA